MVISLRPETTAPAALPLREARVVVQRLLTIARTFSGFGLAFGIDVLTRRRSDNQSLRAQHLKTSLVELGPTFIKLGQLLSCRPDLVPPVYAQVLADLQDQVPPFSFDIAAQTIEAELGHPWEQIYTELDSTPVASASLGQVYKARLKTGEWVAIKVQRTGLQAHISLDLRILRHLASLYQTVLPFIHSDLVAVVDELTRRLLAEIDYIQEGQNAQTFARMYGHLPRIRVPRIYWRYTRRRILTMEWIDGIKITEGERIREWGFDPAELIALGFQFSLQQLLEGGFFHADPHPGNLLITPEGKIAYLDFGMVSTIDPLIRDQLLVSLFHLIVEDFDGLAQDYVDLGFLPAETDLSALIPEFRQAFTHIRMAKVTEFGFRQTYEQLEHLVYDYPFQVPDYYLLVLRCFGTLEGIAIQLNPTLQAFEQAYPYLIEQLLTRQSPTVTACFNQLLIQNQQLNWEQISDFLDQFDPAQGAMLESLWDTTLDLLLSPQGQSLRNTLAVELSTRQTQLWNQVRQDMTLYVNPGMLPPRHIVMEQPYNALGNLINRLSNLAENELFQSPWLAMLPRMVGNPKVWRLMTVMIQEVGAVSR
ncbi:MAG: AarF/ABC1/UbiB kinase family protein [Cyanobacteria bacterium P01_C01_bin.118]